MNLFKNVQSCRLWARAEKGVSLAEILAVLAVTAILSAAAVPLIRNAVEHSEQQAAFQMTLGQMRTARQSAVDYRRLHRLTFELPRTMTIERKEAGSGSWSQVSQVELPSGIEFRIEPGLPTTLEETPDRMGTEEPVDLNDASVVIFRPDGSAVDELGQLCSGVVYLARPGELESARALTVLGAIGRIKGWRFSQGT